MSLLEFASVVAALVVALGSLVLLLPVVVLSCVVVDGEPLLVPVLLESLVAVAPLVVGELLVAVVVAVVLVDPVALLPVLEVGAVVTLVSASLLVVSVEPLDGAFGEQALVAANTRAFERTRAGRFMGKLKKPAIVSSVKAQ